MIKRIPKEIHDLPEFDRRIEKILEIIKERISFFAEVEIMSAAGELNYFFTLPTFDKALLIPNPKMLKGRELAANEISSILKQIRTLLDTVAIDNWNKENIKDVLWEYAENTGKGTVLWPFRVALSGREKSADPFTIGEIIGKEDTLKRLDYAL